MGVTRGQVIAIGGTGFQPDLGSPVDRYILGLANASRPRVTFLPQATGDADGYIARFHDAFRSRHCDSRHLRLFGVPTPDWQETIAGSDVIYVGGGNTANMLAIWRAQGMDEALREAHARGAVLCGVSAGAICWFEASITDSFRVELTGMRDGLGLVPGSCCPHYTHEARRRPTYEALIGAGFPAGVAIDDRAAVHFDGTELHAVVSEDGEATAHRVSLGENGEVVAATLPFVTLT